jgi:hypothetical protein
VVSRVQRFQDACYPAECGIVKRPCASVDRRGFETAALEPLANVSTIVSAHSLEHVCLKQMLAELPLQEAPEEISSGRITDAATVLGLLWAASGD